MEQQTAEFDVEAHQDPVYDLTVLVKGLRMGERVSLPDGTVVRSIAISRGAHRERRFAVVPPGTALDRHRRLVLGMHSCKSAEAAARKALGKEEQKDAT